MKDRKEGWDGFESDYLDKEEKRKRDVLVKQDKSTSAFLRETEEKKEDRAHKLTGGGEIVVEVESRQRSCKEWHTSAREALS